MQAPVDKAEHKRGSRKMHVITPEIRDSEHRKWIFLSLIVPCSSDCGMQHIFRRTFVPQKSSPSHNVNGRTRCPRPATESGPRHSSARLRSRTGCAPGGQCCLEINPFPLSEFPCRDLQTEKLWKNTGISAFFKFLCIQVSFGTLLAPTEQWRRLSAWWDRTSALTLQESKEGKVRKLACSRSYGCVARAGSSCREACFGKCLGGKGKGLVPFPFLFAPSAALRTHDESAGMRAGLLRGNSTCQGETNGRSL